MNPAWERVIKGHLARVVLILARMVRPNEFFSCKIEHNTEFTAADKGTKPKNPVTII